MSFYTIIFQDFCPNFSCQKTLNSFKELQNSTVFFKIALNYTVKGAISGLKKFLVTESTLKMMEKCFLFDLKSFFRSQDI